MRPPLIQLLRYEQTNNPASRGMDDRLDALPPRSSQCAGAWASVGEWAIGRVLVGSRGSNNPWCTIGSWTPR